MNSDSVDIAMPPDEPDVSITDAVLLSNENEGGIDVMPSRSMAKLREIMQRPRHDSDSVAGDEPDLDFVYADCDTFDAEISELYSYTEEIEFPQNQRCFEKEYNKLHKSNPWTQTTETARVSHIHRLLDQAENADNEIRVSALCGIQYLIQGVFSECATLEDQQRWARYNTFLLYKCGVFSLMTELLSMEMDNQAAANVALRKQTPSIADSLDLRAILNVMYTMVEVIRTAEVEEEQQYTKLREQMKQELTLPVVGDDLLVTMLFDMTTRFCSGAAPHFPTKKILLLIWKILLFTLGGLDEQFAGQNKSRVEHNLPPLKENTQEICRNMRAASPPAMAIDIMDGGPPVPLIGSQPARKPPLVPASKKPLAKQGCVEDYDNVANDTAAGDIQVDKSQNEVQERGPEGGKMENGSSTPERPVSPVSIHLAPKFLPWTPKVRQKDLELFLEQTRCKFVGFGVDRDDIHSMIGLPQPIHEATKVLKAHLYTSLGELQIKRETEITKNPLSKPEADIPDTPAERFYKAMLHNLPQYMIALLKILLAAAPTSKAKSDSINILADLLPEEMPTTVVHSMILGMDVNRHKEIIVKAISGVLILLLKHFKLNHIYQFEYACQHLVFANCIPLVLKFFNQNILSYVTAKNRIAAIDFPGCVIGEQFELTPDNLESGEDHDFCWRNMFSCINLLRVLNKLTKWKHSRTMMLVVFKSAPILKRALKVKHAMMQLYVLKLLKMQTKYLGRQWRKSNMKTMSAIYQKVRHRLTDDWAFGNDLDARPWDFQAEESALRSCVDRFNNRRYSVNGPDSIDPEFAPVDNCILSVIGQDIESHRNFRQNYERWLQQEVFENSIDWNQVLTMTGKKQKPRAIVRPMQRQIPAENNFAASTKT